MRVSSRAGQRRVRYNAPVPLVEEMRGATLGYTSSTKSRLGSSR